MKSTKADARYTTRSDTGDRCENCTMFRLPSSCTAVEGSIRPGGWCKFFERKEPVGIMGRPKELA